MSGDVIHMIRDGEKLVVTAEGYVAAPEQQSRKIARSPTGAPTNPESMCMRSNSTPTDSTPPSIRGATSDIHLVLQCSHPPSLDIELVNEGIRAALGSTAREIRPIDLALTCIGPASPHMPAPGGRLHLGGT